MQLPTENELSDTFEDEDERNSSGPALEAIQQAQKAFDHYELVCKAIDSVISLGKNNGIDWYDEEFALFWASMEILKPAIYAKPPKPISSPRFKDASQVEKTAAELIERCIASIFDRGDIDQVMLGARDDLALTNRGVIWLTYESDSKGKRICIDHLDRKGFLHEPARNWSEVGWVARDAWLTPKQFKKRFPKIDDHDVSFAARRDERDNGSADGSAKAQVWEIWHKTDNRVYWVTEGYDEILDEKEPHLNLDNFWPCPRPAYGTLNRGSLVPVPDFRRYQYHLDQINLLTSRIYTLLDKVKLKVLIPAGGDIGSAIATALDSADDSITIPVPAAVFGGAASGSVMLTLPLNEVATTIQGLIDARGQLIQDFYQLSGISDIMRGATEAQETLGAQQLKSQYGSVRVRDKIDELQRLARDTAQIAAEILCDNFTKDDLLELSRMKIPTKADQQKKLKSAESSAKSELNALQEQVESGQMAPEQFEQAQQAIIAKWQPVISGIGEVVVLDDVMKVIKDDRIRDLVIEVEDESTILTDESAEKQSRSEFLSAFSNASQSLMVLLQGGEAGAKLAGAMLKFALQPYKSSREIDPLIDDFVDQAPQLAAQQGENQAETALAEANKMLAEAEQTKAQAATVSAQARASKDQAESQRKIFELQQKSETDRAKLEQENQKLQLQVGQMQLDSEEQRAKIDNLTAQTAKILSGIGLDERKQQLSEYQAAESAQNQRVNQAMTIEDKNRSAAMGERQQNFNEEQARNATDVPAR